MRQGLSRRPTFQNRERTLASLGLLQDFTRARPHGFRLMNRWNDE